MMSLGNWEGEEDKDAEPEELPDWNAEIIPASDGKACFLCFVCLFAGEQEGFLFCAFSAVNVSRLSLSLRPDKVMGNMDGEIPCD